MSKAFDRAMDEVARIWQTSDHFDSGALQFVGIVAAGGLAAAAIIADKVPPPIPQPWLWISVGLVVFGIVALVLFVILAVTSTLVGEDFAAPLDPRLFPVALLKDDDRFEVSGLDGVQKAFGQSLQAYERKRRTFRYGLVALVVAVFAFGLAAITSVTALAMKGTHMATDAPKDTPSTPAIPPSPPAEAPQAQPGTNPKLGPYVITRSRQGEHVTKEDTHVPTKSDSSQ